MPIPTPNIAHNAPVVGDVLHNISLNYHWRQIVGGQLSRLLHRKYWTGTEVEIDTAINQLQDLIHDLYTTEITTMANYQEVERTTTQVIPANTLTKISFANPSGLPDGDVNVPILDSGICTVTARAYVQAGSTGLQYARLLHNGSVIAKDDNRSNGTLQYFEFAHVLEVDDGDTFSVEIYALNGTTVQASEFTPKISMVIIE